MIWWGSLKARLHYTWYDAGAVNTRVRSNLLNDVANCCNALVVRWWECMHAKHPLVHDDAIKHRKAFLIIGLLWGQSAVDSPSQMASNSGLWCFRRCWSKRVRMWYYKRVSKSLAIIYEIKTQLLIAGKLQTSRIFHLNTTQLSLLVYKPLTKQA